MNRRQSIPDAGRSSGQVYRRRVDSTHQSPPSQSDPYNMHSDLPSRDHRDYGNAHHGFASSSTYPRRSTRPHPVQGLAHEQEGRQSSYNMLTPQLTHEYHHRDRTLRETNSGPAVPPHTPGDLRAGNGEPGTRSRNVERPSRSQMPRATYPYAPRVTLADELVQSEPLDHSTNHPELKQSFYKEHTTDVRSLARRGDYSGSVGAFKSSCSRRYTVAEQFNFVRRGSGRRAKIRRSAQDFFGIQHD